MKGILESLNPAQHRAVTTTEGPVLVLAGAGTGKTRVITCRIAYLLSKGVPPSAILAVTFTNKAAREMRDRVGAMVGPSAKELTVSTFHSFCARLLRIHAAKVGLSTGFTICDTSDQQTAVKGALRELRVGEAALQPRHALARISLWKNRLVSPDQAEAAAVDDGDELAARAYRAYESALRRSKTVDFDDLLLLAGRLLEEHTDVRASLQKRYRYQMVDEYQDTNGAQYEILRRLAEAHRNLCVVGDDDQSIYGWRGADVRKILGFERDFPRAAVIRLETNYRSTEEILEAANKVIRHNASRHEKSLRASLGRGEAVRTIEMEDEEHEAECVVDEIAVQTRKGQARFGDFAILFRTQTQPRAFEARLRAARVPYDLVGGMSFFDRKEVRDILAYLRLAANPDDESSLLRVINTPPRGVGKTSIDRVLDRAAKEGISAGAAFDRGGAEGVEPAVVATVRAFRAVLEETGRRAVGPALPQAIRDMLVRLNYDAELTRCYREPVARQTRAAAVGEVLNLAENYARRKKDAGLEGFLEDVALAAEEPDQDEEKPVSRDRVTLMTLHAAKGLEFPRVYLVGVEEKLLPHERSIAEGTVEEERRLMYVGITRARQLLTLTRCKTRANYGRREPRLPSRFIFEMRGESVPAPKVDPAPGRGRIDAGRGRPRKLV